METVFAAELHSCALWLCRHALRRTTSDVSLHAQAPSSWNLSFPARRRETSDYVPHNSTVAGTMSKRIGDSDRRVPCTAPRWGSLARSPSRSPTHSDSNNNNNTDARGASLIPSKRTPQYERASLVQPSGGGVVASSRVVAEWFAQQSDTGHSQDAPYVAVNGVLSVSYRGLASQAKMCLSFEAVQVAGWLTGAGAPSRHRRDVGFESSVQPPPVTKLRFSGVASIRLDELINHLAPSTAIVDHELDGRTSPTGCVQR
ncbi:unnamed protein product [Lampetra fluviatilis]